MVQDVVISSGMRKNLLYLRQAAKQSALTNRHLASGKKINSAIDNPASFFTASALNARASNLNRLIDNMEEGIQSIKTATSALGSIGTVLDNALSVTVKASEAAITDPPVTTEWLLSQEGVFAVVTTEDELRAAVDSGKIGKIVLNGAIEMTNNTSLILKNNQELIGTGYYGDINTNALDEIGNKKAKLTFITNDGQIRNGIRCAASNTVISDIEINFTANNTKNVAAICAAKSINAIIRNVDINFADTPDAKNFPHSGAGIMGIQCTDKSTLEIRGNVNIVGSANYKITGLLSYATFTVSEECNLNIRLDDKGFTSYSGMYLTRNSTNIFKSGANINIFSSQGALWLSYPGNTLTIEENVALNFFTDNASSFLLRSTHNESSSATKDKLLLVNPDAEISINIEGQESKSYRATEEYLQNLTNMNVIIRNFDNVDEWQKISKNVSLPSIESRLQEALTDKEYAKKYNNTALDTAQKQYEGLLEQINDIVKDASYKGINLLKKEDLKIVFNENGSSSLTVKGVDSSTAGLGLNNTKWSCLDDVKKVISELSAAINRIGLYAHDLGLNYTLVSAREAFTQTLCELLGTGADMLTNADMNEESANLLALQTRQELAVNALTMAASADSGILNIF